MNKGDAKASACLEHIYGITQVDPSEYTRLVEFGRVGSGTQVKNKFNLLLVQIKPCKKIIRVYPGNIILIKEVFVFLLHCRKPPPGPSLNSLRI